MRSLPSVEQLKNKDFQAKQARASTRIDLALLAEVSKQRLVTNVIKFALPDEICLGS